MSDPDRYTVSLELSRQATRWEMDAATQLQKNLRIYGSTLELSRTTLEQVGSSKDELAALMARVEEQGRSNQEASERRLQELEDAREAERERLRVLAEGISFD